MSSLIFGSARFDRASIPRDVTNVEAWPTIDASALDPEGRSLFTQRCEAMRLFIDASVPLVAIATRTGVSRGSLHRLFARCIAEHDDGRIHGFRALVPFVHTKPYERRVTVPFTKDGSGAAGAFRQLLARYPTLEPYLQAQIRKRFKRSATFDEIRPPLKKIHKDFLSKCRDLGVKPTEYPFNRERRGKRSLSAYAKQFAELKFESAAAEAGAEHIGRAWSSEPSELRSPFTKPMEGIEFDGHRIDVRLTLRVPDPYGMEVLYEIERIWILALKDIVTRVIPGYALALGANYAGDDVIDAVKAALVPHRRRELTIPGLTYDSRGGFPSEVIPECAYACWDWFRCDNAASQLADATIERLVEFVGCWPDFGEPGNPDSRPFIESFFKLIAQHFAHRMIGTTGSGPDDFRRKLGHPGGDIRLLVTLNELEELIDVLISDFNGESHGGIGGRSPLEAMQFFVARDPTVIRPLARARRQQLHLLQDCLIKTVKGSVKNGVRPHINFKEVRYSNDVLSGNPALIGRKLRMYYDRKDIRHLRAYFENGEELGVLMAQRPWCFTPHSLKTRQEILRLKAQGKLRHREGDDPVEAWTKYKRHKARKSRRAGTDLARLSASAQRAHVTRAEHAGTKAISSLDRTARGTPMAAEPAAKPKVKELHIKKAIVF